MITLDYLKSRVELTEEKDFVFRWLKIENPSKYSSFNSRYAGNLAGSMREDGYIIVNFEGCGRYFLHKLAYVLQQYTRYFFSARRDRPHRFRY
ncbi:putative homing endonuclease [Vibrio phage ICP1]|uniref:Uncharacterized protein ORF115 n=1 Tax=Vibrio phage ICP1 TaxID=979525 RepID=F1D1D7_9CAUD|nr:hypothetical protein ViPhICP1_gp115 [Vibrio phage ICP1]ADX88161.1 hypothetical protein TUST1-191_00575 [Vibrio phage ICP1_2006_D]ADX88388.1 hypothetical protein TUST1-182_00575 [Vibrio phage ICP1_2006_C]ASV41833.1 hypothetical protein [Vibrio phage JSF1]QFR59174.1 hypothetical protein ICP12017FMathbaria_114 [Vibrio phage ICP1_2017_F_Mathbaria]ADX87931.1 hypothetical protein [Vibrio phage ICP1]